MLARIRKAMDEREEGFTLIELLVVMIIIGILAAIAIPVFLNQRAKAQDSAAKADVSTIGKETATWYVDNATAPGTLSIANGRYQFAAVSAVAASGSTPAVPASALVDIGKASANVAVTGQHFTSNQSWCVDVTNSAGSQKVYKYSATGGLATGACLAADYA